MIKFLKQLPFFCMAMLSLHNCNIDQNIIIKNTQLGVVDSLMQLMTIEEKIGQLSLFTYGWDLTGATLREKYKEDIRAGKVGAVFSAHSAEITCALQHLAVEETRLGIPLIFGYDVIHGYKTIFPIPLGETASWDMELIEKSAQIAADESTAAGLHWTFAPMVDIARDPRWGRVSEGAGEDVFLGETVAKARVRGFQGKNIADPNTLIACAKHYAAYGAAQAGRDYHTVDISMRTLMEVHLPPFKAAKDAGIKTFMTAFNELNGVPTTGNKMLLRDILKEDWGFDGFVVSDYTSINEMVYHGNVANEKEAAELALNAGVDMDMQGNLFNEHLATSLEEGRVTIEQINDAVRRILTIKQELGLFDDPYKYCQPSREKEVILSASNRAISREVARSSIVLLKNNNKLLPLSKEAEIALIGPLGNTQKELLGSWHAAGKAENCISVLAGLQAQSKTNVAFAEGCHFYKQEKRGFEEAVALANKSDIIIMALGESAGMSGEAASRSNIGLPEIQVDLLKEIKKTGKPIIVVLMNGRPLSIPWIDKHVDAIVEAWFLGTEAGNAIADVIYGAYNPSGKLPVTFPRSVGQIPIYYCMKNTGRPMDEGNKFTSKYLDIENTPLYPFGYGLSYTTFEYTNLTINKKAFSEKDTLKISFKLSNVGGYDGHEVAQLYVRDKVGSVTRPVRELKAFEKIFLRKGTAKTIVFSITAEDLKFYDINMNYTIEPGAFDFFVGTNSNANLVVSAFYHSL